MSVTTMFRWLDLLEKEFDKGFVELDILLGEIDIDQYEITQDGRQRMTALSSSFAQLAHKAQTIFQANAKLEVRWPWQLWIGSFIGLCLKLQSCKLKKHW